MIELEIVIKSFVDLFASGRSSIKVIVFLVFSLFSIALFYVRKKEESSKRKYTLLFISTSVIIFIFGIFFHVHTISLIETSIGDKIIYMSQSEISSSEIKHTHEMKAVFGNLTPSNFRENIDMGHGLVDFVPDYGAYVGLSLLILALFFYSFSILRNEYANIKQLFFYTLISFILLKNSIDGGILNHEVVAVFLFFSTYFLIKKNKGLYAFVGMAIVSFVGMFYFYPFHIIQTYVFILCIYILLFKNSKFLKGISYTILILFTVLNIVPNISYLHIRANQETPGIIASFVKDDEKKEVYVIGNMYMYETDNGSVKELLKKYDLAINHRPISFKWQTCVPNTYKTFKFKLFSEESLLRENLYKDRYYNLEIKQISPNNYAGILKIENCFSQRFENQVQEGLRELQILPAIMYQISKS